MKQMYSHTKKVGSLGRHGVRVGKKLCDEIKKIEDAKNRSRCPNCNKKIKRTSPGIWECSYCKTKFAGGSYLPLTTKKSSIQ